MVAAAFALINITINNNKTSSSTTNNNTTSDNNNKKITVLLLWIYAVLYDDVALVIIYTIQY